MQLRTQFCVALIAALGIPALALADTTITGEKKGAFYQITVPTAWNGDLVIHNHGFDFNPPGPNPSLGSLASLQLSQGYAVAASSYSNCCWTLFSTKKDLNRLLEIFEDNFGAPNDVIVWGGSLGGIVTAQAVETLDVEPVGAYPICGALAGSRSWDGAIDLRLVYDAICNAVPGGSLPGGATGLPAPGFPPGLTTTQIATAVNTCTGVLTPPAFRTPAQQARLNQLKAVTQLPENFIVTDMVFVTNGLSNLIFASDKLDGGQGVGNIGVTYNDAGINASIQRVAAANKPAKELKKNYTPKGEVERHQDRLDPHRRRRPGDRRAREGVPGRRARLEPERGDRERVREHPLRLHLARAGIGLGGAARLDRGRPAADRERHPGALPDPRAGGAVPLRPGLRDP